MGELRSDQNKCVRLEGLFGSSAFSSQPVESWSPDSELEVSDLLFSPGRFVSFIFLARCCQARILELKRRYLKITVLKTNTPYPSRKIRRICACTHQRPRRPQDPIPRIKEDQYAVFKLYGNKIFWKILNVVPTSRNPQYTDYWKMGSDEIEPTGDESSDFEETDHDNEQKIKPKPVKHTCKPFNYKTGCSEWPTWGWRNDGFCNGGNLPGAYIIGNSLHYQDYEWYEALEDSELKEEALRNKAIMEGLIDDDNDDESHHEADEREELCEIHELLVCTIRRFEMMKYSFEQDEEYVAVKEDEYDDLTRANKNACRAYQEIFRMMDEGWMVTRAE
ncbi:hypothetical protein Tco_0503190 [Tanacetum coccineum]